MDHYRNPRNHGVLDNPDFETGSYNPSCGDQITLYGLINDNLVERVTFTGKGCVISQATASILTDWAAGKRVDDIRAFTTDDLLQLLGMPLGPNRLKCALLALEALHDGIKDIKK